MSAACRALLSDRTHERASDRYSCCRAVGFQCRDAAGLNSRQVPQPHVGLARGGERVAPKATPSESMCRVRVRNAGSQRQRAALRQIPNMPAICIVRRPFGKLTHCSTVEHRKQRCSRTSRSATDQCAVQWVPVNLGARSSARSASENAFTRTCLCDHRTSPSGRHGRDDTLNTAHSVRVSIKWIPPSAHATSSCVGLLAWLRTDTAADLKRYRCAASPVSTAQMRHVLSSALQSRMSSRAYTRRRCHILLLLLLSSVPLQLASTLASAKKWHALMNYVHIRTPVSCLIH